MHRWQSTSFVQLASSYPIQEIHYWAVAKRLAE